MEIAGGRYIKLVAIHRSVIIIDLIDVLKTIKS